MCTFYTLSHTIFAGGGERGGGGKDGEDEPYTAQRKEPKSQREAELGKEKPNSAKRSRNRRRGAELGEEKPNSAR